MGIVVNSKRARGRHTIVRSTAYIGNPGGSGLESGHRVSRVVGLGKVSAHPGRATDWLRRFEQVLRGIDGGYGSSSMPEMGLGCSVVGADGMGSPSLVAWGSSLH
jgi:hypothetical protein